VALQVEGYQRSRRNLENPTCLFGGLGERFEKREDPIREEDKGGKFAKERGKSCSTYDRRVLRLGNELFRAEDKK